MPIPSLRATEGRHDSRLSYELSGECVRVVIRTYWFPGFNEASGTSTRNWCHGADHVEAWRPRVCGAYPTILPLEGRSEHATDRWLPPVEPRPEGHVTP